MGGQRYGNFMSENASSIVKKALEIRREEGMRVFLKKALSFIYRRLLDTYPCGLLITYPYGLLRIKYLKGNLSLNELVDFSSHGIGGLINPLQVRDEILELLRIVNAINPKVIIEIGTANGGTLFLFSRIASEDATIISVDLPGGMFLSKYVKFSGYGGYPKWRIPLYKSFALVNQHLHLIKADSHNQATLEEVKGLLNGRDVDFLFIDGDHSYEGVKKDFEMYSPLVKNGGIIAFHDLISACDVSKLWSEIKGDYIDYIEIIKDQDQGRVGIGVLFNK